VSCPPLEISPHETEMLPDFSL